MAPLRPPYMNQNIKAIYKIMKLHLEDKKMGKGPHGFINIKATDE